MENQEILRKWRNTRDYLTLEFEYYECFYLNNAKAGTRLYQKNTGEQITMHYDVIFIKMHCELLSYVYFDTRLNPPL